MTQREAIQIADSIVRQLEDVEFDHILKEEIIDKLLFLKSYIDEK